MAERNTHKRMRSLLRNYYGIDEEEKPQQSDPLSLDAPNFSKEKYLQKQLKTKKLSSLVTTEVKLKKDCDRLDSEMKTLVYENYNKFISATDTIQQMKKHINDMDDKMKELQLKIEGISKSTTEINEKFAENRKDIEKYSGISSLLKKRQFLFELPTRLHKCIEMQHYQQAVKYYNKSKEILDKYKHLPSFGSIDKESIEIIVNLKEIIRDRMEKSHTQPKTVTECTSLLLELGENPDSLCDNFLTWRARDLQNQLQKYCMLPLPELPTKSEEPIMEDSKAEEEAFGIPDKAPEKSNSKEKEEKNLSEAEIHFQRTALYLQHVNHAFLREVLDFSSTFEELFIQKTNLEEKKLDLQKKFDKNMFPIFTNFTTLITEHLITQKESTYVLQCLEILSDRYAKLHCDPNEILNIGSRILRTLTNIIYSYMQHQFDDTKQLIDGKLTALQRFIPSNIEKSSTQLENIFKAKSDKMSNEIFNDINKFITSCDIFIIGGDKKNFLSQYSLNIWDKLKSFTFLICDFFAEKSVFFINQKIYSRKKNLSKKNETIPSIYLCLLSRLFDEFEKTNVSKLNSIFSKIEDSLKTIVPPNRSRLIRSFDSDGFQSKIQSTAQLLLREYVKDQGTNLTLMIRQGIETPDWSLMKEPSTVRSAIELVVQELQSVLNEVKQVFDLLETQNEKDASSNFRYRSLSSFQGTNTGLIGGIVEYNANSIICSILKIGLKSFIECVRLCTFNQYGYQQMQVDIAFMRLVWKNLRFDKENTIDRLLDDVIESTTWRCFELNPMSPKIIESIYQEKAKKYLDVIPTTASETS